MRLAPKLAALVGTEHRYYVEPYAGSAAVLMRMPRSRTEVLNDLDREVYNFWKVLREQPDALIQALKATPYSRDEYHAADFSGSDLERARHFVVRSCQSFSGSLTGGFGGSTAYAARAKAFWFAYSVVDSRIPAMAERLRGVELHNRDALEFLERWDSPDTAAYVDPPYLASARNSERNYRTEVPAEHHVRLLERLNAFRGRVVLSGYESELYSSMLPAERWEKHRFHVQGASGNSRGYSPRRVEVAWVKPAER